MKTKNVTEQTEGDNAGSLDPLVRRRLRKALLLEDHGTPNEQKDALVNEILNCFQDPAKWPLTDTERIELLKMLYGKARWIPETEAACAAA